MLICSPVLRLLFAVVFTPLYDIVDLPCVRSAGDGAGSRGGGPGPVPWVRGHGHRLGGLTVLGPLWAPSGGLLGFCWAYVRHCTVPGKRGRFFVNQHGRQPTALEIIGYWPLRSLETPPPRQLASRLTKTFQLPPPRSNYSKLARSQSRSK